MNRKALFAILAAVVGFAAVVATATILLRREYRSPNLAPAAAHAALPGDAAKSVPTHEPTPRDRGVADEAAAKAKADLEKPYVEADYRPFPKIGSRTAIWVVAQLHLLFAAFVLAVPLFALIIEFIGYKTKDKRYDKLAHEFT